MKYPILSAVALTVLAAAVFLLLLVRPMPKAAPTPTTAPAATSSTASSASTSGMASADGTSTSSASAPAERASSAGESAGITYAAGTGIPKELPEGEMGKLVKLGQELVHTTAKHPMTAKYVGNSLNCTSCHLQDGQTPKSGSFVGLAAAYPAYSKREGGVINLEDRIANCYMRSMNGKRPPVDDRAITAVAAYITWLSQGAAIQMNAKQPLGPNGIPKLPYTEDEAKAKADKTNGQAVYAGKCAACHGPNGEGQAQFPPLWGKGSYNDGAGMHQILKSASWIKVSMPLGNPTLTEQEALDVALYINSQPRPKFVMGQHLLPGQKPPVGTTADGGEQAASKQPLP